MKIRAGWVQLVLACVALACFFGIGIVYTDGYAIRLRDAVKPRFMVFLAHLSFFGGIATVLGSLGLADLLKGRPALERLWARGPDAAWVGAGMLAAFVLPLVVYFGVLQQMDLTSDEAAYRFASEHLAMGRLWADSPPDKVFYDRMFLINDGRLFTQYFLGWPALMVPGTLIGAPWLMNPLYNALCVPLIFGVIRRVIGPGYARLGVLLWVASPMLIIGAATTLSHTSCLFTIVFATWLALQGRDEDASLWWSAGLGGAIALAVFVRPLTGVSLGAPLVVWWLSGLWGLDNGTRLRRLLAFAAPALTGAACFLAVNQAQHGHLTGNGYKHYWEYLDAHGYQFSGRRPRNMDKLGTPNLTFRTDWAPMAKLGMASIRLHFAWLGWPLAWVFLALARPKTREQMLFPWMVFALFAGLYMSNTPGIDSYGPVHYTEVIWPLLVVLLLGVRQLASWTEDTELRLVPYTGVAMGLLCALVLYVPVRVGKLAGIAESIRQPVAAVEDAGIHDAVVFVSWPWAEFCPDRHYHKARPIPSPDLSDDILWLNDVGTFENHHFMKNHFPNRRGYVMTEKDCVYELTPVGP